jgi:hypothetical protein
MFVGHTAVALAAKSRTPRTSLGVYVAAAYALDLLWPALVLLGVERVRIDPGNTAWAPLDFESYPWSHSLVMALLLGLAGAAIVRACSADRQSQLLVFLLVVSHWVLDFASHRPDMPLWPGASPKVGLGLWNSVAATLAVEGALFAGAVALYVRATSASDRTGVVAFWLFVGFQALLWATSPWSPPPPNTTMLGWVGIATWLFPVWAWWFDRHRVSSAMR